MPSYNHTVIVGNVCNDIELKYLPSGTACSEFNVAVNERRKSGDGYVEDTTFVPVVLFQRSAEVAAEYATKGSAVLIEGRLKMDSWEKEGKKQTRLKVIGNRLVLLGGKKRDGAEPSQELPGESDPVLGF